MFSIARRGFLRALLALLVLTAGAGAFLHAGDSPAPASTEERSADTQRIAAARVAGDDEGVAGVATTSTTLEPTTTTLPPPTTTTLPVVDPSDRAPGWEERRGEAALARIGFDPTDIGYEIRFLPERRGYYGMTYPKERRIDVWVRPDQSLELLTHVTAHELGHAVDLTWNDDARRAEYLEVRGLGSRSWFTCDGCTDFSTPAGDFAEVFASWAVGETDFRSTLAPAPPAEEYGQLEKFFAPSG